uniref:osteoclast-stimulating factor 1-like n=1 Tax=Myxine glutinosa TaxID=7769 RepID=UPI00358F84CA
MASKTDKGRVGIVSKAIPPKPAKPGKVKVYRALYTFEPRTPDELSFEEGDILYVSDTVGFFLHPNFQLYTLVILVLHRSVFFITPYDKMLVNVLRRIPTIIYQRAIFGACLKHLCFMSGPREHEQHSGNKCLVNLSQNTACCQRLVAILANDPIGGREHVKVEPAWVPSNYVAEQAQSIDAPLQEAAKRGNVSWLHECLDNGVSINGLDKAGNTALYWAAHGGHLDIVDILLSYPNIELNHQNKLGDTSLHAAAWKGHPDIIQSLLEKGIRVDLRNNEKKYAADMATDAQSAALIKRHSGAGHIHNQDDEYLDEEDSD